MTNGMARGAQSGVMTALSLLIGTGGIMITGVQPLLLGSLLSRDVVTASELGLAGSVEIFALAAGIVLGSRILLGSASRRYIVFAALAMAALNLFTGWAGAGWQIVLLRALAGLSEGVLIAVIMLAIAHSDRPERLGGFFLSVSGPPSLIMAYFLPSALVPQFGWDVGFVLMAMTGLICALAGAFYHADYSAAEEQVHEHFAWTRPVLLGLAATLLANAAFGASWTYIEPLATSRGIDPVQVGELVTFGIGCMISGSLAVALSGRHFRALGFLQSAASFQVAAIVILMNTSSFLPFTLALGALCFFWQASAPCAIALMAALDETRVTASLSFPIQLTGLSIGPLVAATGASRSLAFPYLLGALLLVAAGLILVVLRGSSRQTASVQI